MFDIGTRVDFNGRGLARGLGVARISGSVDLGFYSATDRNISGKATLSTPRGTLSVRLGGATLNATRNGEAFGSSFEMALVVESGTGAYQNVRGAGTATMGLGLGTTQSNVPISPSDPLANLVDRVDVTQGTYSLRLNLPALR
jgi:hypothetical protein